MSLMNGLSSLGEGISKFAGVAGAEQMRANTASDLQQSEQGFRSGLQTSQQTFLSDLEDKKRAAAERMAVLADGLSRASRIAEIQETAKQNALAPTTEIKSAQQFAKLTPAERAAYREEMMTKAGLPAWMIGGNDTPSSPTGTPGVYDTAGAPAPPTAAPTAEPGSSRNDGALKGVPDAAASIVKGMVDGRIAPPSSFAMSKPYWQGLISKAAEYDPTFDQTTWAGRVATRKSFSAGQDANAVTALNTALGHASRLSDQFEKLSNFGGIATPLNMLVNPVERAFGDERQTNVQQTVDALASEARKVFAASGGGNLTELQEWQKNFPVNGSPSQQKGALTNFVELLDSRLQSLAEKYNRGMGRTDDPLNLLQPNARAAYKKLTGLEPRNSVGNQMGRSGPAATQDAEAGVVVPDSRPPLSSFMNAP